MDEVLDRTIVGAGPYYEGETVTLTALPRRYFNCWKYDDEWQMLYSVDNPLIIEDIHENLDLIANFHIYDEAVVLIYSNMPENQDGTAPFDVYQSGSINIVDCKETADGEFLYTYQCIRGQEVELIGPQSDQFIGWEYKDKTVKSYEFIPTFAPGEQVYIFKAKFQQQQGQTTGDVKIRIMSNGGIAATGKDGNELTRIDATEEDWTVLKALLGDEDPDDDGQLSEEELERMQDYIYVFTCKKGDVIKLEATSETDFIGWWDEYDYPSAPDIDDYDGDYNAWSTAFVEYETVMNAYIEEHCVGGIDDDGNYNTEFTFTVAGDTSLIAMFAEEQPHQPTGAKIQVKTNGEVQFTVNGETVTSEPTTDDDDNYIYTLTCSLNDEVEFSASGWATDHFAGWWLDCDEAEFFFSEHERGDESYWEDLDKYCVGGYVVDQDAQEIEGFKTEFTKTITADLLNADNVWALTAMFDGVPDTKVKYTVLDENTATLTHVGVDYFNDERTSFDIPQAVDIKGKTYTVAAIGEYAFYGCSGLKSVTIPASVTTIGEDAFLDCRSMTSATFASVEALCTMTFENEHSNPMFPYDPAWNEDRCEVALYFGEEEKAFPSVEIPTTVNSVGQYAFINCRQLTSVNIPSNVKTLGNEAFARCVNLSSVTIAEGSGENGLQELKFKAFNQCAFTTIVLPNTLTTIGNNAFDNCDYLASVTIPASVTNMGEYVFSYIDETDTEIICLKNGEDDETRFSKWKSYWYVAVSPHTITVTKKMEGE